MDEKKIYCHHCDEVHPYTTSAQAWVEDDYVTPKNSNFYIAAWAEVKCLGCGKVVFEGRDAPLERND